jgi:hypothetical protein
MQHTEFCICVHCGMKLPHKKAMPCREVTCVDCGRNMVREGSYHHRLYLKKIGEKNDESSSTNQS